MSFLQIQTVTKQFGNQLALDNISFDVSDQSVFGLLGPNGAGKTTLIRIINQITRPDSGLVLMNGVPMTREDVAMIGYLPEERGLYKKMKVGEQALYLAQLKGMSRKDALKQLKYWFEKFEIQPWWDKKIEELSKGMQQKVQFVTTVLHRPRLLIFDEPFSGFDPINANMLKQEILELKAQGSTIIFSTHNMASVEELCDHIALINQSKLVISGEVKNIRQAYREHLTQIEFSGKEGIEKYLPGGCELVSVNDGTIGKRVLIKAQDGITTNLILSALIPVVTIHSVSEVLPSMNDIFIRLVSSQSEAHITNYCE